MRNFWKLTIVGSLGLLIFGMIVGGVIMIGYGLQGITDGDDKKNHHDKDPVNTAQSFQETLLDAKKNFQTHLISQPADVRQVPPRLTDGEIVTFPSPGVGNLKAYISETKPGLLPRAPAVIWVHNRFAGIDKSVWKQAKIFADAGFVLFCPSFRGENFNPGRFEYCFGEVDDLIAAVDYLKQHPAVDPTRIYVAGYETGGAMTLLAATSGITTVRAFFSIGGFGDLQQLLDEENESDPLSSRRKIERSLPFMRYNLDELRMRSAVHFVQGIRAPVYCLEGEKDGLFTKTILPMERMALSRGIRFSFYRVPQLTHESIVQPAIEAIAKKIELDKEKVVNIQFNFIDFRD